MSEDELGASASMLLVTGTVGSGKTATAYAIGDELRRRRVAHAVIDLDELRRAWPAPADDPFNECVGLANLAAVAANYRRSGTLRLVAAGVVEGPDERAAVAAAVGVPLVVVRLEVDLARVRARLQARHEPGEALEWHLARSGELDGILGRQAAFDVTVDVGTEHVDEVARRVLAAVDRT